jgi:hypothetical protein
MRVQGTGLVLDYLPKRGPRNTRALLRVGPDHTRSASVSIGPYWIRPTVVCRMEPNCFVRLGPLGSVVAKWAAGLVATRQR